mgnify:CR=1 FL=1
MNNLQPFNNPEFGTIRTLEKDNEVWFIGKDVAEILGYSNTRDALTKHVDSEDKAGVAIHDGRQNRSMIIINESGLYSLVLSSKLPTAKKFKRWVTNEVLPSIRKHGIYATTQTIETMLADPDNAIRKNIGFMYKKELHETIIPVRLLKKDEIEKWLLKEVIM